MFEDVAHGYYILVQPGLFGSWKGPVLLNYGIDECRFTKFVPEHHRCQVDRGGKIAQERREPEDVASIVKYREVTDHKDPVSRDHFDHGEKARPGPRQARPHEPTVLDWSWP